jgi:hypothetical protein
MAWKSVLQYSAVALFLDRISSAIVLSAARRWEYLPR